MGNSVFETEDWSKPKDSPKRGRPVDPFNAPSIVQFWMQRNVDLDDFLDHLMDAADLAKCAYNTVLPKDLYEHVKMRYNLEEIVFAQNTFVCASHSGHHTSFNFFLESYNF